MAIHRSYRWESHSFPPLGIQGVPGLKTRSQPTAMTQKKIHPVGIYILYYICMYYLERIDGSTPMYWFIISPSEAIRHLLRGCAIYFPDAGRVMCEGKVSPTSRSSAFRFTWRQWNQLLPPKTYGTGKPNGATATKELNDIPL